MFSYEEESLNLRVLQTIQPVSMAGREVLADKKTDLSFGLYKSSFMLLCAFRVGQGGMGRQQQVSQT